MLMLLAAHKLLNINKFLGSADKALSRQLKDTGNFPSDYDEFVWAEDAVKVFRQEHNWLLARDKGFSRVTEERASTVRLQCGDEGVTLSKRLTRMEVFSGGQVRISFIDGAVTFNLKDIRYVLISYYYSGSVLIEVDKYTCVGLD